MSTNKFSQLCCFTEYCYHYKTVSRDFDNKNRKALVDNRINV